MNPDTVVAVGGLIILALGIIAFGIITLTPIKTKEKAHN
ncbi:hypothetical protein HG1285_03673 [Hydrogenivirga sp. 128-5-R1-1]|nr:hypothetical protein HG1285_03673 [Hydrogenivirga sp. 128-5-R1-1]